MKRVVVTGFGAISPLGHDWPTVLAALVAFLLKPEAAYITRQVISVNGGMLG